MRVYVSRGTRVDVDSNDTIVIRRRLKPGETLEMDPAKIDPEVRISGALVGWVSAAQSGIGDGTEIQLEMRLSAGTRMEVRG